MLHELGTGKRGRPVAAAKRGVGVHLRLVAGYGEVADRRGGAYYAVDFGRRGKAVEEYVAGVIIAPLQRIMQQGADVGVSSVGIVAPHRGSTCPL